MAEETGLTKAQTTAVAQRPAFLKQDRTGTEHITKDDIQLPRIALAQGLSPQLDPAHPSFIDGLKIGQFFNTLTGQIYGEGPIPFLVIAGYPPRYIEFYPRTEGGGVKDFNVPANDPRTQFSADGKPPVATKFYDFAIYLLETGETVMLSLKSTSLKVARQLNTLIGQRNAAIYAGQYKLTRAQEQNKKGKYWQFVITNNGWAPDENVYNYVAEQHNNLRDKTVRTDYTQEDDVVEGTVDDSAGGDTSFNPDRM